MDAQEVQEYFMTFAKAVSSQFEKIPGSAILARYIKSSYQNDPVRSAVELFLVLFAVRYLLAPKYSTKPNYVKLSEEVVPAAHSERVTLANVGDSGDR
jgi:serine palmitoyltransferase